MFIARVSKGRTIREFVTGVLFAPTLAGFVWLTIFGDTALWHEVYGAGGISEAVNERLPTAIFEVLDRYPLAGVTGIVCTVSIVLFFVTSSDSASLVVDTLASGGDEEGPVKSRIFWAVLEGLVAGVLLFTGGLAALQTATIITALPFCLVIVAICWALIVDWRRSA